MAMRDPANTMRAVEASLKRLSENWWLLLLQGVVSVIFGILMLIRPGATLAVLIAILGWFVLINGVISIISAIGSAADHRPWGWRFAGGILGVLVGLIILRWPGETALTVLLFVGYWAILVGLMELVGSVADHAMLPHAWLVALEGVVTILFGIAMVVWPVPGLLTLALLIGIYAIVHGLLYCGLAFQVRSLGQRLPAYAPPGATSAH